MTDTKREQEIRDDLENCRLAGDPVAERIADDLLGMLDEARRERDELKGELEKLSSGDASTETEGDLLAEVHRLEDIRNEYYRKLTDSRDECTRRGAIINKLRTQVKVRGQHLTQLSAKLHEWNEAVREAANAIGYSLKWDDHDQEPTTGYPPGIFPGHVAKLIAWALARGPDKLLPMSGEAWRQIRHAAQLWFMGSELTGDEITESRFRELVVEALRPVTEDRFDFVAWCERHREWSERTFGPADERGPMGPINHLKKEIEELADAHDDIEEVADIIHLAVDAAQRAGHTSGDLAVALASKQAKNFARTWPDWRTQPKDSAIKHVRTETPTTPATTAAEAWSLINAARAELAAGEDEDREGAPVEP